MAWCPFAVHRPLSENHVQGGITPRAVILHTAVSSASSLFDFFQNRSDLESHFYVADNGTIEQYMDTQIRADANKNANSFAVSIETEDGGKIVPWTQAQLDSIVRLVDWLCSTHGIPRRQIPAWDSSGIGWHVQFGAPGPWTPVAKSCPGGPRIEQTKNVIIPRVAAGQITESGFLMALSDVQQKNVHDRIMGFLRQRWFVVRDGKLAVVPEGTSGAIPATALDTLDGNYLVGLINDLAKLVTAPAPVELDYEKLATLVAAKLGTLRFDAE